MQPCVGQVGPKRKAHFRHTALAAKPLYVKPMTDGPLVVGILECLSRTTIWGFLECFFECPALRAAFSSDNSADRFLFLY